MKKETQPRALHLGTPPVEILTSYVQDDDEVSFAATAPWPMGKFMLSVIQRELGFLPAAFGPPCSIRSKPVSETSKPGTNKTCVTHMTTWRCYSSTD